ncbi:hypothetical protein B0T16DRAFT_386432 [Cercophora newfieldiana]|uniref:Extracellular membrane protein CFEM domain-containing protein n=1 Tax=Cercophora newfieldiana TaxID=92897 RepID=A0AA40D033_9PEZI|nr:hypothetical protein B0T16DRAFT_386432 [Cercophora newfieldiana]
MAQGATLCAALLFVFLHGALAQTTSSVSTSPISPTALSPTALLPSLSCLASTRCNDKLWDHADPSCRYTTECYCVAWNSTWYRDCVKEKCPSTWESIIDERLTACNTTLGIDLSGNTTYTGMSIPSMPTNTDYSSLFDSGKDGKLSQSDKIAIGIGVGFGIPSLLIGLGAWLCVRRRAQGAEKDQGDVDHISSEESPQTSPPEQPPETPGHCDPPETSGPPSTQPVPR